LHAIRIALDWDGKYALSPLEVGALKQYAGFGGLKAILQPPGSADEWKKLKVSAADMQLNAGINELHELLRQRFDEKEYKAIVDSLRQSALTAYYTPPLVPRALYSALQKQGISPRRIYEPSAGVGVFITEAAAMIPGVEQFNAVEKDKLTGKILTAICSDLHVPVTVQIKGLEETPATEKGQYDLVVSNIPFGNLSVYDPAYAGTQVTSRIHNYFFAKGLDKLADGGIMAYLTTDFFLNTPSNDLARKHLFTAADFISLSVLPDNLMKDNANVEAPSHLLIVQKNDDKHGFSTEEALLIQTVEQENVAGKFPANAYLAAHPELVLADEIGDGTNQY
ncbi:MAG: SAM-dependent DNA methyltransferase, partial [Sphingobacteriales bacterium]